MNNKGTHIPGKKRRFTSVLFKVICCFVVVIGIITAIIVYNNSLNKTFITTFYQVSTTKDIDDLRIVQISDVHAKEYGEDNSELVSRVEKLEPDIIAITGDLIIYENPELQYRTINLLKELVKISPVYYEIGNHEFADLYNLMDEDFKNAVIDTGVNFIVNGSYEVTIDNNTFWIGGFYSEPGEMCENTNALSIVEECTEISQNSSRTEGLFTILLCHYPTTITEDCENYDYDLALSGHEHGGQVRIPYLMPNGIWSKEQGFNPAYTSGKFTFGKNTLIISRGMSNSDHFVSRINNQPELVVIDVN